MLSNSSVQRYCNADGTGAVLSVAVDSTLGSYDAELYSVSPGGMTIGTVEVITAVPSGTACYFKAVPPGRYRIRVQDAPGGAIGSVLFIGPDAGGGAFDMVACGADCSGLTLVNAAAYRQDWRTTGNLTLDVGSAVAITGGVLMPGNIAGFVSGTAVFFAGLPAGSYSFALLAGGNSCILFGTVALVLGCTNPLSVNYNPLATDADPAAPCEPWDDNSFNETFAVPACQSLTFVPGQETECGTYPDPAQVLFNTAARNRQESDFYAQHLTLCDAVRVQIWTSYPGARVILTDPAGAESIYPAARMRQYRNLTGAATGPLAITPHPTDPRLGVLSGFVGALPAWAVVGQLLACTFNGPVAAGTYRIFAVDAWARTVALRMPLNPATTQATVTAGVYHTADYDVFETAVVFTHDAPGCYRIRAEGLDVGGNMRARWDGEPIELATAWDDCHQLDWTNRDRAFGIDYATGITHRRRIPAILHELGAGGRQETTRDGAYALVTLGGYVTDTVKWQTTWVPPYLNRVLARAFAHDAVWVDGVEVRTDERYRIGSQKGYALGTGDIVLERAVGVDVNRTDAGAELTAPSGGLEYNSAEYN